MVDIHCHIIPGIDDGAQSLDESLSLIRMERDGGTRTMVATPHVYTDQELLDSDQIPERLHALRLEVERAGIDIELVPGAEVYPSMGIAKALDMGKPITVNGHRKHMLVDLPMGALPMDFDTILFEIQARGITPILAHPERNAVFQHEPKKLIEYIERGIALQVDAGSLKGKYGQEAIGIANYILKKHWAHFLASDAHKVRPKPMLQEGVSRLSEKLSSDYLQLLTKESGRCVVEGRPLPQLPTVREDPEPKKGFLSRLFGS
jgi:protein-tyrosine phosphatase